MKRYGLSALLLILIIVSIGTYYVQAADNDLPQYRLMKLQGDEQAAEGLMLEGFYRAGLYTERMKVGIEGSKYDSDKSFLDQFYMHTSYSKHFNSIISSHRQFLPGRYDPNSFYENDDLIVYASTPYDYSNTKGSYNFRINLSIWDKKAEETRSLDVPVTGKEARNLFWIHVDDVQMVNGQFKIFTTNLLQPGASHSEDLRTIHLYSIDEKSGKLTGSDELLSAPSENNRENGKRLEMSVVPAIDPLAPSSHVVYRFQEFTKTENDQDSYSWIAKSENRKVYDLAAGQLKPLPLHETEVFKEEGNLSLYMDETELVRTFVDQLGLHIFVYRLVDNTASETLLTLKELGTQSVNNVLLSKNKLYISMDIGGQPGIAILDRSGGNILYKGAISVEGSPAERERLLKRLSPGNPIITE
ncbi:hypothetical protein [Paenibacillus nasutitermitis]|uniref:Uncharacterized protein n=1 Tax=Paenibacillus nasutitermitis TaxID=1652958 RepID=A0A917DUS2_9BACL|nr:hypothetical protein [Paenibacillus nasutitermitis]GGD70913.1 hypothetical protein GCM10010911_30990 [Paenibacillus nasutitermitis]